MRPRVKICGVTSASQARAAADAGADAVGLVFYSDSPRAVDFDRAAEIAQAVPAFVTVVGLFMDPDEAFVREALDAVPLELLQFHGQESPAFCAGFGRRYIKALGMTAEGRSEAADLRARAGEHPAAAGVLVDSHAGDRAGGTGEVFDWRRLPRDLGKPLILAGGLRPENVAEAVRQVQPWALDVSSGVESEPGRKDPALMTRFLSEVYGVR